MEKLTPENIGQSIIPTTWEQLQAELPETMNALVMAALGLAPGSSDTLPIWYVLTKAAGVSGIALERLYNDPMERQHALAVMAADAQARERVMVMQAREAQEHERAQAPGT